MERSEDRPPKPASPDALRSRLPAEAWQGVCCGNCPDHDWWDDEQVEAAKPICFGASDALDPVHLARTYALSYQGPREISEEHAWASQCVFAMLFDHPVEALEIIRLAAELAETDWQRTMIGCGNLESLLGNHDRKMIGAVEQLARESPAFRYCLGNVWQHGMADDVYARVLAASGRDKEI
jgi:hypothetical protein